MQVGERQKRRSVFAALLAVSAIGAASSPVGFGPQRSEILNEATRVERTLTGGVAEPVPPGPSLADVAAPPAPEAADAPLVPVPEAAPAPGPAPLDQPIVAPASFSTRPGAAATSRSASNARFTSAPSGPKAGGVWAVIVGVDDYPGEGSDLRAGTADARDVDTALAHYGVPADRRILLLDRQATALNIKRGLAWLAANASADATAVFFFSGHVRQVSGFDDGDREEIDEALVAADGVNVFDGEVAEILSRLEARTAWIGVAGCYGSGFDDVLAPGRIITAAAAEPDLAYENSALGHSYLVEYMVRRAMLQGAAPGSVQDAFNWARDEIARDYPNRVPVMVDQARGPLVLGAKPAPAPAPAPAKAEPAPARSEPQPEPKPGPTQQPAPQPPAPTPTPPPGSEAPGEGTCAEVLGVGLCQEGRSRSREAAWRPSPREL